MDAVSYPNEKVVEFINKNIIPLRVSFDAQPLAKDFNIKWTPTLVVVDAASQEHSRTVGFLPPEELIPSLLLGIAKTYFDGDQAAETIPFLDNLLKGYPRSSAAPEAVYLHGVASFKNTHDPKPLKGAYERLLAEYPESEWVKRASPYGLL